MRKLLHFFGLLLTGFAAIALLLGNVAPFVDPQQFWPPALLGLGFGYLLLFNVLLLIYFAWRRKWLLIIPLIAIALSYNNIGRTISVSDPPKPNDKILTVKAMSYNVRNFDLYNWKENLVSKQKIMDEITETDPDIIAFQEFYTNKFSDNGKWNNIKILSELGYQHNYFHPKIVVKDAQQFGMAIFSKYPIVHEANVELRKASTNGIIYTDILIESDTLRFFNVHLQSIHLGNEDYEIASAPDQIDLEGTKSIVKKLRNAYIKRSKHIKQVRKLIESSPYPVLLCGDFNDTPVSYAYQNISTLLQDAYTTAGLGFGGTYAGPMPSFRIDYFFAGKELEVFDYQTLNLKISDHYPITTDFYIE